MHGSVLAMASLPADHRDIERESLARLQAQPPDSVPAMRRVFKALIDETDPASAASQQASSLCSKASRP